MHPEYEDYPIKPHQTLFIRSGLLIRIEFFAVDYIMKMFFILFLLPYPFRDLFLRLWGFS